MADTYKLRFTRLSMAIMVSQAGDGCTSYVAFVSTLSLVVKSALTQRKQCMTVPVGVATWWVLPDTPYTTRAWYMSEDEKRLAIDRVAKAGKAAPKKITLATFQRVLTRWR